VRGCGTELFEMETDCKYELIISWPDEMTAAYPMLLGPVTRTSQRVVW